MVKIHHTEVCTLCNSLLILLLRGLTSLLLLSFYFRSRATFRLSVLGGALPHLCFLLLVSLVAELRWCLLVIVLLGSLVGFLLDHLHWTLLGLLYFFHRRRRVLRLHSRR
jgi:hypothetical protein